MRVEITGGGGSLGSACQPLHLGSSLIRTECFRIELLVGRWM